MITSLRLTDFKNFADETLPVGPFTVIVGANASGKSNIRDAFRFLHGVGRGYTLADAVGGKYGDGGEIVWAPIRGGLKELVRAGRESLSLGLEAELESLGSVYYEMEATLDENRFQVTREMLRLGCQEPIRTTHPGATDPTRRDQLALTQLSGIPRVDRAHEACVRDLARLLARWRFLDPDPACLRQPACPGKTTLGNSGENLPAALRKLCADTGKRDALLDWVRELTAANVVDFEFPSDSITGHVQLVIREQNGKKISAHGASDGTLRVLALLVALLDEDAFRLYFFENIDNGIHPSRLHLLVDLIERQTGKGATQVITTTHSPDLLSMVSDETFQHVSVVCRSADNEDAVIRPVSTLPDAPKLRKTWSLGRLLAEGWMETALAFTENGSGDPHNTEGQWT